MFGSGVCDDAYILLCSTCKISCLECWNIEWAECRKIKGISHEMHFGFCLTRAHMHTDVEHVERTRTVCYTIFMKSGKEGFSQGLGCT